MRGDTMGTTMKLSVLAAAAVLAAAHASWAAGVGTTGAQFLKVGVGARPMAMGNAFSALADDANAVNWNPGALAEVKHKNLTASYNSLFKDQNQGLPSLPGSHNRGGREAHGNLLAVQAQDIALDAAGNPGLCGLAEDLAVSAETTVQHMVAVYAASLLAGIPGERFKEAVHHDDSKVLVDNDDPVRYPIEDINKIRAEGLGFFGFGHLPRTMQRIQEQLRNNHCSPHRFVTALYAVFSTKMTYLPVPRLSGQRINTPLCFTLSLYVPDTIFRCWKSIFFSQPAATHLSCSTSNNPPSRSTHPPINQKTNHAQGEQCSSRTPPDVSCCFIMFYISVSAKA